MQRKFFDANFFNLINRRISSQTDFQKNNWMLNILGYYSEESKSIRVADNLFQSCLDQSLKKNWFKGGKIKNEFRTEHGLLLTHIWILHKRLLNEQREGKLIQEALFDTFWNHTTARIRSLGINELSVNKNLLEVQKYSFAILTSYDKCYTLSNANLINDELKKVLINHIWINNDQSHQHVMKMIHYLHAEYETIQNIDYNVIEQGMLPWKDPPFKEKEDSTDETSDWREALANNGKTYYWNIKTRETMWEVPLKK